MSEKITAGRDLLGNIAPKFSELNDDILFGEVWAREDKLSTFDYGHWTYGEWNFG